MFRTMAGEIQIRRLKIRNPKRNTTINRKLQIKKIRSDLNGKPKTINYKSQNPGGGFTLSLITGI